MASEETVLEDVAVAAVAGAGADEGAATAVSVAVVETTSGLSKTLLAVEVVKPKPKKDLAPSLAPSTTRSKSERSRRRGT